jgi:hypothetical protein
MNNNCPVPTGQHFNRVTQEVCEAHASEHPELIPIPGFQWPEDQVDLEDKAKKVLRDAEKTIDEAGREMKKQIKKATGKP